MKRIVEKSTNQLDQNFKLCILFYFCNKNNTILTKYKIENYMLF